MSKQHADTHKKKRMTEAALLQVYVDNRLLNASGIQRSFTQPFFS
jgi:hypothetical protein